MWKRLSLVAVFLGGCSFALQPHGSNNPKARQPSAAPVVVDTMVTVAAIALAVAAANAQCYDGWTQTTSTANCWGMNYIAAGALVAASLPFGASAVFGYHRLYEHEQDAVALVPLMGQPPPLTRTTSDEPLSPPGLALTCEQGRDALLAQARLAAQQDDRAVVVRNLPQCDNP
jgi:hypothetical protein